MPVGPLRRVVRTHRRAVRRTAWIAGTLVVLLVLWGNGIHNIGSAGHAANGSCTPIEAQPEPEPPQLPGTPRDELPDPTQITGQTTAYTQTSAIAPVAPNPELSQRLPATVTSDDGPRTDRHGHVPHPRAQPERGSRRRGRGPGPGVQPHRP